MWYHRDLVQLGSLLFFLSIFVCVLFSFLVVVADVAVVRECITVDVIQANPRV